MSVAHSRRFEIAGSRYSGEKGSGTGVSAEDKSRHGVGLEFSDAINLLYMLNCTDEKPTYFSDSNVGTSSVIQAARRGCLSRTSSSLDHPCVDKEWGKDTSLSSDAPQAAHTSAAAHCEKEISGVRISKLPPSYW